MSTQNRELTLAEAVCEALAEEMRHNPKVFVMGESVGPSGGTFKVTDGLWKEFGPRRVVDTPIAEEGFAGLAVGAAMTGMHPVIEIMFGDFITLTMDQLVNQAAKMSYMTGGQASVPMVVRTNLGAGRAGAAQHSQSLHAWFAHIPGLRVLMPSTPYDAKGLLKSALRYKGPVIFYEHKLMYKAKGPVPEEEYFIPFGVADIKRQGTDITVVATSRMVQVALEAADTLGREGISVEVVDPRTISPLDIDAIVASVEKTHRVLIVDEGHRSFGAAAEIGMQIMERAFDYLDVPIRRYAGMDVPVPFSSSMEQATFPNPQGVVQMARELVGM